jgi:hypothetical protein
MLNPGKEDLDSIPEAGDRALVFFDSDNASPSMRLTKVYIREI